MQTLAQAITVKYMTLQKEVEALIGTFPLPKIPDDISVTDLVFMVCTFFSSHYKEGGSSDYRPALTTGAKMRGVKVDEAELEKVYPLLAAFLDWLIPELRKERK